MSKPTSKKIQSILEQLTDEEQKELLRALQAQFPDQSGGKRRQRGNLVKRGNSWQVRITVDGKQIRKSAGHSRQAAQLLLSQLRLRAERGKLGLPRKSTATVSDWSAKYLDWARVHKKSAWRDEIAISKLLPFFGSLRLTEVTKSRVEAYQKDRGTQVSGPTINREIAILRKLLSHAVDGGELENNPLTRVGMLPESPARQPKLEPDDEKNLLDACDEWLAFLVRLAIRTGCRQGELLNLQWKHIDIAKGAFVVENSKSGDSRRVPLHPEIQEALKARRGLPEAWVVVRDDGKRPTRFMVSDAFRKALKKSKITGLRFHDLRHVAATRLLATGATLPEVQTFTGHRTLAMARRYSHTDWNRLKGLVERMA